MAASLLAADAAAQSTVEARSTTAIISRPTVVDGQVESIVPLYALVWVRGRQARGLGARNIEAVVSGWGSANPVNPVEDELLEADLDLAYVQGELFGERLMARVGRQSVVGGAARWLQMDGARIDLALGGPMTLTLYGGAPVTPRFGTDRGDAVGGTRLFWRQNWRSEIGASFIQALDDGRTSRQDIGFDARYSLSPRLAFNTLSTISTWEQRLVEAKVAGTWVPVRQFSLRADASRVAPDLLLSRASVLSVFAGEDRDEAGGSTTIAPRDWVEFDGNYHVIVRAGDVGQRGGGGVTFFDSAAHQTRLTLSAERLTLVEDGYVRGRVGAGRAWFNRRLTTSLELDGFWMDEVINDTREAGAATAHVGYRIADHWRVVAGGLVASSPTFSYRTEGTVRVVFEPDVIVVRGAP